jgi:tetratricopeptide (TPR) repeat protein
MANQWSFRYTVSTAPAARQINADDTEKLLLRQLENHERAPQDVLWDLVRFYSATGRQGVAVDYCNRLAATTESPERKAFYYMSMGCLLEQLDDFASAINCYSAALSLEPIETHTWYFINNNLGYCLNQFGRYTEAESYCRTAIHTDPARYNAYKNLGVSLESQGRIADAARCYIMAVKTNAADSRALTHLQQLVAHYPEVGIVIPDFTEYLHACRTAVRLAAEARSQFVESQRADGSVPVWRRWLRALFKARRRNDGRSRLARATLPPGLRRR